MNDNTKVLDQKPLADPTTARNQSPIQPTGNILKEKAPIGVGLPELKPSGPEVKHTIDQELQELGVEERKDKPDLTFEHRELGVDHAGPHVPVPSSPSDKVIMPMSEEEIENQLKTGESDDSGKWLAGLIKKVMKALGL